VFSPLLRMSDPLVTTTLYFYPSFPFVRADSVGPGLFLSNNALKLPRPLLSIKILPPPFSDLSSPHLECSAFSRGPGMSLLPLKRRRLCMRPPPFLSPVFFHPLCTSLHIFLSIPLRSWHSFRLVRPCSAGWRYGFGCYKLVPFSVPRTYSP